MGDTASWFTFGSAVVVATITAWQGVKTHQEGVKAAKETTASAVEVARIQADAAAHLKAQDQAMQWVEDQANEIRGLRQLLIAKEESEDKLRAEIAELRAICEQLKRELADLTAAVKEAGLEIRRLSLSPATDQRIANTGSPTGTERRQT